MIKTADVAVGGKSATILTDVQGMTLYYRTSDSLSSVCSAACAHAWPPLIFKGSGTPSSETQLPGVLGVSNNVNGTQVSYQGHPLYTYAADGSAGKVTGQGLGGVWFVATVDLPSTSGANPTPTPGSGYGGY